jgi:redox-sensing transcriptional repressor
VAVPADSAQTVADQLVAVGIKAILNFAPASLHARPGVKVKTVDLTISLESLSYFLARPQAQSITNPRGPLPYEEMAQREENDATRRKEMS